MTLGSLFDGIGVFPLAASRYGITAVWASEIEQTAVSITKRHLPHMEQMGDITKLNGGALPPVDVITFGSPCQNFSQIGDRKGLEGKKSGLFYEAIRIINEMRGETDGIYPAFAIFENVAGTLSSNDGMDYRTVLSAFAGTEVSMPPAGKWASAGMVYGGCPDLAWRLMDSFYFYSAQRRKRVFLVADYRGKRAAKVLFDPAPLHEIIEHGGKSGLPDASCGRGNISKTGRGNADIYALQTRKMRGGVQYQNPQMFLSAVGRPNRACPTLLTGDPQLIIVHYPDAPENDLIRRLTPLEFERLMCLPEGWTKTGADGKAISDAARYRALGNSIVLTCAEYIMSGIAKALLEEKKEENQ